jgi:peptide/nickel transport system substrate-binding protein
LLDEAGYPRGEDGKRFSLRLTFNPYNDGNRRSAEYIRQALGRLGIDAPLSAYDFAAYVKTVYTDRAFDIEVEQLSNMFDPTIGVQRVYWSKNFKPGLGFSNGAHYNSPEADRLLEAAAVEPSSSARRELFVRFQKVVYDDLPLLNLVAFDTVTVFNRRVHDHTLTADGLNANFADVYLDG